MIDFNLAKESLIEHLNRSCENSDGTIFWCDGTMTALFAMMSLCFDIEHNHKIEVKPASNADKIRMMSDEKLAEFIEEASCPPTCYRKPVYECRKEDCIPCWLAWLQAEVKE